MLPGSPEAPSPSAAALLGVGPGQPSLNASALPLTEPEPIGASGLQTDQGEPAVPQAEGRRPPGEGPAPDTARALGPSVAGLPERTHPSLGAALRAPIGPAPIAVTGVEVLDRDSGDLEVRVTADGPIVAYKAFMLPNPARLVLDILNATHAIRRRTPGRPPLITAIRSSQFRDQPKKVVRVVLDLPSVVSYKIMTDGNQLRVDLRPAKGTVESSRSDPHVPAAPHPERVRSSGLQRGRDSQ